MADSRWEGCTTRVYMRLEGSHGSYFSLFNRRQVKRDERKKKGKNRNGHDGELQQSNVSRVVDPLK